MLIYYKKTKVKISLYHNNEISCIIQQIFNKKGIIRRKTEIVVIILAYNYYYLNAIVKNNSIEDIILKNNSKIEKYVIAHKTQNSQFINLFSYILFILSTITIFILLNNINNKNF